MDPGRALQPLDTEIRAFADRHDIELVPTPTYASYLNRIEKHLRRPGRVRLQEHRLPRLVRLRARARRPRPSPQQPRRTRTPKDRNRHPTPTPHRQDQHRPQARRLNDDHASGPQLREGALALAQSEVECSRIDERAVSRPRFEASCRVAGVCNSSPGAIQIRRKFCMLSLNSDEGWGKSKEG